jgi:hypothetical protein
MASNIFLTNEMSAMVKEMTRSWVEKSAEFAESADRPLVKDTPPKKI